MKLLSFSEYQDLLEGVSALNEKLITFNRNKDVKFGNVVILAGGAGCYPHDTEYFDGTSWKVISEYTGGSVLQYEPESGEATLTDNVEHVVLPTDQFYTIQNRRLDFTTSADHKHLLLPEKGSASYKVAKTTELYSKHDSTVRGNRCKLLTCFKYNGKGIDLTDDEIRLRIAIIADGHFLPRVNGNKVRMSFSKTRKIERFRLLLELNNIFYKEYQENKFTRFEFFYPVKTKKFDASWYNCTQSQLLVVTDEIIKWDGSYGKNKKMSYNTNEKESVNFAQFAFSACGYDTRIQEDNREGRNTNYGLTINSCKGVGIAKNHDKDTTTFEKVDGLSDKMYCFTVPTGFFVVRQKGKIYVSGNSGKGFVLSNLIGIQGKSFDVDELKSFALKSKQIAARLKDEYGIDVQSNPDFLKTPENVSKLHLAISDLKLPKTKESLFLAQAALSDPSRKPNIIFDVTLKDMAKLVNISQSIQSAGYDLKKVHIVWVVNKIDVAMKQNAQRDRVVDSDILLDTHEGAARVMRKIVDMGDGVRRLFDGDMYFAFNQVGVDSELVKSGFGGKYVKEANYVQVKKVGHAPLAYDEIENQIVSKIVEYTPKSLTW